MEVLSFGHKYKKERLDESFFFAKNHLNGVGIEVKKPKSSVFALFYKFLFIELIIS